MAREECSIQCRGMLGHGSRLPLAILATVVAAGAATLLLRPRSGLIEPDGVQTRAYFSQSELDRAREFRRTQRLLGILGLGLSGGTLVLLVARPPSGLLERVGRRPLLGAAGTGAGIALLIVVARLPVSAVAHKRAFDVGLSTQQWGPWLGDLGKSAGIEAGFAAAGGAIALALVRRFPRGWWVPAAGVIVVIGVLAIYLLPVLVDPLFNKFERLPDGRLRSDVLALASKADVDVGEVYRVDASRRTTAANAYVGGLGATKRVVLYDNLLERFPADQVISVVAHELAHARHRDLQRGLLWLAIVAPAGTYLVQRVAALVGRGQGLGDPRADPGPAVLPAIALSLAIVSFALGSASNVLSRQVEARADAFSLRLTRDPEAFIGLERRLALSNVADPNPPRLYQLLFGTHPTTVQRIGIGEAFARMR